jgi:hypothetical protein
MWYKNCNPEPTCSECINFKRCGKAEICPFFTGTFDKVIIGEISPVTDEEQDYNEHGCRDCVHDEECYQKSLISIVKCKLT